MRLHEIELQIAIIGADLEAWAEAHDGDITDFPMAAAMEDLKIDRNRKLLSLACLVKDIEAEAEALSNEAKKLSERARVKSAAAERIKSAIANSLEPGEKLADNRAALSWRKSESVEVDVEPGKLPFGFRRETVSITPDRAAIKTALKAGTIIPGASIVAKQNLQIK